MNTKDAIEWFKKQFGAQIESALGGTPFGIHLVAAIGFQETGYLWRKLIGTLAPAEILKVCVGDTFDAPNRDAFPQTKADLLRAALGPDMFAVARAALEAIAKYDDTYARVARSYPNKFCHGFGIFQYDIQFFRDDPDFFLARQWYDFDACMAKLVTELQEALKRQKWSGKTTLDDKESVYLAIAYNAGHADVSLGFKQGHKSDGKYYGENIDEFLRISKSDATAPSIALAMPAAPAIAPLPAAKVDHALLKFGKSGDEVKVLQSLLQSQGYFSGAVLGNFREKTRQAVIYFQQTHLGRDGKPLEADGEVGDDTWWALYHPSGGPQTSGIPSVPPDGLTPLRAKVLDLAAAEHQAGVREDPDGSNWGDGVVKYLKEGGSGPDFWCCFFWSWCVHHATNEYPFGQPMGHVLTTWRQAKAKGWAREKDKYSPVPGDAFVLLYTKAGKLTGSGHIGFVLRVDRKTNAGAFNTVEGNCGNRVKVGRREMDQSTLVGFINQYADDEQPTNWETGLIAADDVAGEGTR